MGDADSAVETADHYRHPDGTVEVVYALEDGAVLTFREYPNEERFATATAAADYLGEHPGVAELPDVATEDGDGEQPVAEGTRGDEPRE